MAFSFFYSIVGFSIYSLTYMFLNEVLNFDMERMLFLLFLCFFINTVVCGIRMFILKYRKGIEDSNDNDDVFLRLVVNNIIFCTFYIFSLWNYAFNDSYLSFLENSLVKVGAFLMLLIAVVLDIYSVRFLFRCDILCVFFLVVSMIMITMISFNN